MNKKSRAKRLTVIIGLILLGLFLGSISVFFIVYRHEIKTITSLEKLDEYGMFEMTYYGDYGFDELLKSGAKNGKEIGQFIIDSHSKWFPNGNIMKISFQGGGCTAFFVKNEKNEYIYGRNFDFDYSPSLILHTNPKNGFSSVSTVNLKCLGFNQEKKPRNISDDNFSVIDNCLLLAAPYLPFDGMNERGVTISLLTVPEAEAPYDENKVYLNTTTAIRLVLDNASNVEEAVALLSKYNIHFSNNAACHYFIADTSGTSLIVEYIDGEMKITYPTSNYQIASNFIAYQNMNIGQGQDRYDILNQEILNRGHILPDQKAIELLAKVGIRKHGVDCLQWSVLYNLSNLTGEIFAHRKFEDRSFFTLD